MYAYTDKVQFLSKENLHNVLEKVYIIMHWNRVEILN